VRADSGRLPDRRVEEEPRPMAVREKAPRWKSVVALASGVVVACVVVSALGAWGWPGIPLLALLVAIAVLVDWGITRLLRARHK